MRADFYCRVNGGMKTQRETELSHTSEKAIIVYLQAL